MSEIMTRGSLSRRSLIGGALAVAGAGAAAASVPASARAAAPATAPSPTGMGPEPPAEMYFHVLPSPVRAYDSRSAYAPDGTDPNTGAGDTALAGGSLRTIDVCYKLGAAMNATGVPESAAAVLFNLTITGTVSSGWLRVWSHGATEPTTSAINWTASGVTTANMCVSACSGGYIDLRCGPSGARSTHVIIDVIGYYTVVFTGP